MFVAEGICDRCGHELVVLWAHYAPEGMCLNCIAALFENFRLQQLVERDHPSVQGNIIERLDEQS